MPAHPPDATPTLTPTIGSFALAIIYFTLSAALSLNVITCLLINSIPIWQLLTFYLYPKAVPKLSLGLHQKRLPLSLYSL